MLNKLSCLAATFLIYDEHEPFDRVVQASSLYRISVSTTRAASSTIHPGTVFTASKRRDQSHGGLLLSPEAGAAASASKRQ
jgi:hypothetical protein